MSKTMKHIKFPSPSTRKGVEQRTAARAAWRKLNPYVRAVIRRQQGR